MFKVAVLKSLPAKSNIGSILESVPIVCSFLDYGSHFLAPQFLFVYWTLLMIIVDDSGFCYLPYKRVLILL